MIMWKRLKSYWGGLGGLSRVKTLENLGTFSNNFILKTTKANHSFSLKSPPSPPNQPKYPNCPKPSWVCWGKDTCTFIWMWPSLVNLVTTLSHFEGQNAGGTWGTFDPRNAREPWRFINMFIIKSPKANHCFSFKSPPSPPDYEKSPNCPKPSWGYWGKDTCSFIWMWPSLVNLVITLSHLHVE